MSDNILSQAEIDALLNDDAPSTSGSTIPSQEKDQVRPYNPNTQRRVIRERMQSLKMINERFARQFRMGLFNMLRRSPDITVGGLKIEPYHEFARNLPVPTNLNLIHMPPLRGTALFTFEPTLVYIAVDNLFGGDGRFPVRSEGKEFTNTEQRIINRMLKLALGAYRDAWKPIADIDVEYVRSEIQVKFTNITTSPNDIVVTTPFLIEIGNTIGEFSICIPIAMIEPLRERLINPPVEQGHQENETWVTNLVTQVKRSELELVANFVDIPLRISRLLQLQKGDVIPFEKPERLMVSVDGVPVLTSQYGTQNGQYALRVEHLINPVLNTLDEESTNE